MIGPFRFLSRETRRHAPGGVFACRIRACFAAPRTFPRQNSRLRVRCRAYTRPLLCGVPRAGSSFRDRCLALFALRTFADPFTARRRTRRAHDAIPAQYALGIFRRHVIHFAHPLCARAGHRPTYRARPRRLSEFECRSHHADEDTLAQPIFLGASNTIASLTQLRHRFVLYSVSPLLYNLGIIFGAIVLYPIWGIAGLGWGVVFGA